MHHSHISIHQKVVHIYYYYSTFSYSAKYFVYYLSSEDLMISIMRIHAVPNINTNRMIYKRDIFLAC